MMPVEDWDRIKKTIDDFARNVEAEWGCDVRLEEIDRHSNAHFGCGPSSCNILVRLSATFEKKSAPDTELRQVRAKKGGGR